MCHTKKCTKCGSELPLDRFSGKRSKDGRVTLQCYCKECQKIVSAIWYQNNKKKANESSAKWRENNPERDRELKANWAVINSDKYLANIALWRKNNPDKVATYNTKWLKNNPYKRKESNAKYERARMSSDPSFRMIKNIRATINSSLRGCWKSAHTVELLGCSVEEVRSYLEGQFQLGMTWDNWGLYGWHIDHIIPLSYFDMADPEQQKRAWHYTNLRPLWAADNYKKRDKVIEIQLKLQ